MNPVAWSVDGGEHRAEVGDWLVSLAWIDREDRYPQAFVDILPARGGCDVARLRLDRAAAPTLADAQRIAVALARSLGGVA